MASAVFRSTDPVLIWPVPQPDADLASLVLGRMGLDISGGDGIWADPAVFERMHLDERPFAGMILHWQREAHENRRLLVVELPFSWRGSRYSLFLVDPAVHPTALPQAFVDARRANFRQPDNGPPILRPVLYQDSWATPTILRREPTGELWVLEQGHFIYWQPEWQVHAIDDEGVSLLCRVIFNQDGRKGLDRMPPEVKHFAALADEALGPGRGEGTLGSTQSTRNRVAHFWTVIAERPWALTATPYNSRGEVEAGLEAWAEDVPARDRLHQNLLASLQPAQRALTNYLADRFAIGVNDSRAFAAYAIDFMLRSYFTFHREVRGPPHRPSLTPWPESVR